MHYISAATRRRRDIFIVIVWSYASGSRPLLFIFSIRMGNLHTKKNFFLTAVSLNFSFVHSLRQVHCPLNVYFCDFHTLNVVCDPMFYGIFASSWYLLSPLWICLLNSTAPCIIYLNQKDHIRASQEITIHYVIYEFTF